MSVAYTQKLSHHQKEALCELANGEVVKAGRWVAAESLCRKRLAHRTARGGYELSSDGENALIVWPIAMVVRRMSRQIGTPGGPPCAADPWWQFWGMYGNQKAAELAHKREIEGRGVTAWSWFGRTEIAARLLADSKLDPDLAASDGVAQKLAEHFGMVEQ